LGENNNISLIWKHLGKVHQSNQILPICNSFIQLQTVLFKDGLYRKAPLKF